MSRHKFLMVMLMVATSCALADDGDREEVVVWDNLFNAEGPYAGYKNYSEDFGDPPDVVGMVAGDVHLPFGTVVTGGRLRFFYSAAGGVPDGIIFFVWKEKDGRLLDEPVTRYHASEDFQVYRDNTGLIIEGRFDGGQFYVSSGEKLWWTILPVLDFPPQIFALTTEEVIGERLRSSFQAQDPSLPWSTGESKVRKDIDFMFQLFHEPAPASGDLDVDGDIDLMDVGLFFDCARVPVDAPLPQGCFGYDFDADGDVDVIDYGGLQVQFTGPCGYEVLDQPSDVDVCPGDAFDLIVEVDADHVDFQWRRDGVPIPDETTDTLSFLEASDVGTGTYDCVVSDNCDNVVITSPADVTVWEDVVILTPPQGGTFCAGDNFTLFVVADAVNEYHWLHNGASIDDATETVLIVTDIDTDDAGIYQVLVTGDCGSLVSPPVDVEVLECP